MSTMTESLEWLPSVKPNTMFVIANVPQDNYCFVWSQHVAGFSSSSGVPGGSRSGGQILSGEGDTQESGDDLDCRGRWKWDGEGYPPSAMPIFCQHSHRRIQRIWPGTLVERFPACVCRPVTSPVRGEAVDPCERITGPAMSPIAGRRYRQGSHF